MVKKIRPHFWDWEVRCGCCDYDDYEVDDDLWDGLEKARSLAGDVTITVHSANRCARRNYIVGGKTWSRHLRNCAADVTIEGMNVLRMFEIMIQIPAFREGGIGIYPKKNMIHVDTDTSEGPRRWVT